MRIYLDHNATAPLRPEARAAMLACLDAPMNPSSAHREGAAARRCVEDARADVAALIGARPAEIVFTSGATEANNLALRGLVRAPGPILTTAIEHASVLETARAVGETCVVGVDNDGHLDIDAVIAAAGQGATLASIGLANGEIGAVAPVAALAGPLRARGLLVHSDAAQAAGRVPIDVQHLAIDALSVSSHKLGGPVGVGALWLRDGCTVVPLMTGGAQERSRRAGTENVPAIVGFGAAARAAARGLDDGAAKQARQRDLLWQLLFGNIPHTLRNGPTDAPRLPNTLNVSFAGCAGESLLVRLDLAGVAISLGSACAAGGAEPSHVLLAMGRDADAARSGIRFSLGPTTVDDDLHTAAGVVAEAVAAVRRAAA